MEKAIVNMSNWELYVFEGRYNLSGTADYHPSLGKNAYIAQTSTLQKYSFEEDVLTYETRNTIYICPIKYMHTKPYGNVVTKYKKKLAKLDEESDSMLDKIIAASAKLSLGRKKDDKFVAYIQNLTKVGKAELRAIKRADDRRVIQIAKNYDDCIYIEVSNVAAGDKLAYHIGDSCGTVEPEVHKEVFRDSVIYMKHSQKGDIALDFGYLPIGLEDSMETCSWSDNIKQAVIKNMRDYYINFNGQGIAPGETKAFQAEDRSA